MLNLHTLKSVWVTSWPPPLAPFANLITKRLKSKNMGSKVFWFAAWARQSKYRRQIRYTANEVSADDYVLLVSKKAEALIAVIFYISHRFVSFFFSFFFSFY